MGRLGVENLEPWQGQQLVAGNAYWWWAFKGFAVISDRPTLLKRDAQFRLHAENGPALAFADGWAIHAWHGTRVPADLITEGWSTDRVLKEENAEIRRCAIEKYGWAQFIEDAEFKRVGRLERDPANPGYELGLYSLPRDLYDDMPVRVLVCTNAAEERDGTRRRFGLTVPATCKTPMDAASWTFGLTADQYKQLAAAG